MDKIQIKRILKHGQKGVLPAINILSALSNDSNLYHQAHGLRHPAGVYNTSIQSITERAARVLSLLSDQQSLMSCFEDKVWQTDVLETYDALLDALMEHMDDCRNVLLCFFQDKEARKKHPAVKEYEKSIDWYRNHIGLLVNHIKHKQGRLRLLVISNSYHIVPGYFVEGVSKDGTVGPHERIHTGGNDGFSFYRDLRLNMAGLLQISEALRTAIQSIISVTDHIQPSEGTGIDGILEILGGVAKLPHLVFPNEQRLDWPRVSVKPATINEDGLFTIEFPSYTQRPITLTGQCNVLANYRGDGTTKSFRLPVCS